jgi:integrase
MLRPTPNEAVRKARTDKNRAEPVGHVELELVAIAGEWYARVPLARVETTADSAADRPPPVAWGDAAAPGPRSRALVVGHLEHVADVGRFLLVPVDAQAVSFSHREAEEGRLLVLGATRSIETRTADLANVPQIPVRTVAEPWITSSASPFTRAARLAGVQQLLTAFHDDDLLMSHVDVRSAQQFLAYLEARRYAAHTIKNHLVSMKSLWTFAGQRFDFQHNPFRGMSRAVRGRAVRAKRRYRTEEIVRLLRGLRGSSWELAARATLAIALFTGARRMEVAAMRPEDLEETRAATWWTIPRSKTSAGIRRIPITHAGIRELIRLWIHRPRIKISSMSRAFDDLRASVCVDTSVDFHSARRTVANVLERAGANPIAMTRYIGHRPIATAFRVYSRDTSDVMLIRVARLIQYPATVDQALTGLLAAIRADAQPRPFRSYTIPHPRRKVRPSAA